MARGSNYTVVPWYSPIWEYVAAIEVVCLKFPPQAAEELRAETKRVLKYVPPKSNITKDEANSLKNVRLDKDRVILTADKGVAMIVLDRQDYISKDMNLLVDRDI